MSRQAKLEAVALAADALLVSLAYSQVAGNRVEAFVAQSMAELQVALDALNPAPEAAPEEG